MPAGRTREALEELKRIGRQMDALDASAGAGALVARTAAACEAREVTFALVGEYNSGKSSLLNLFLGKPVAPVGRFPETGAVCHVRGGTADTAHGRWRDASDVIGPTLDELRAAISITRGGRRADADLPDSVDITASGIDIPDGVVFTDTPGVNDDPRMTRLAFDAAADAEVLIWVFHSRQYLSMQEAEFLRALVSNGPPPLCVFVVNMFLEEESPASWAARCREDEPHYRAKLSALVRELDLEVAEENRRPSGECGPLFVSARAGHRDADVFGGAAFRRAVERLVNDAREELLGRRHRRILRRCLCDLAEGAAPRARLACATHEQSQGAHAAFLTRVDARHRFTAAASKDVAAAIASFTSGAAAAAASINAAITAVELTRDAQYETDLNRRFRELGTSVAGDLAKQLRTTARAYGQPTPDRRVRKDLAALFKAPLRKVTVPNASVGAEGPAGAAVAGAIAGSVVPVIGTLFGAIAGGLIGLVASTGSAIEKDVAGVKSNITRAATSATTVIVRRKRRILAVCTRAADAVPIEAVPAPDPRPMEAWQAVVSAIESTLSRVTEARTQTPARLALRPARER